MVVNAVEEHLHVLLELMQILYHHSQVAQLQEILLAV
jgi:hypothetical protein